ncbi:hypothetical protein KYLE_88 [Pantoea phage Kyle]|uniref:Uncharacterized protein n=1 Tax=Pantoea phage Kyle TaxID=2589665 RepID=A0A514A8L2_9CAUD|nr:hypothetical protein HWC52_gp088 [Pantoea phage Kyle]QDH49618.1 hypothetical protein KYLE_88 [Pantoea phage Kyle]
MKNLERQMLEHNPALQDQLVNELMETIMRHKYNINVADVHTALLRVQTTVCAQSGTNQHSAEFGFGMVGQEPIPTIAEFICYDKTQDVQKPGEVPSVSDE